MGGSPLEDRLLRLSALAGLLGLKRLSPGVGLSEFGFPSGFAFRFLEREGFACCLKLRRRRGFLRGSRRCSVRLGPRFPLDLSLTSLILPTLFFDDRRSGRTGQAQRDTGGNGGEPHPTWVPRVACRIP